MNIIPHSTPTHLQNKGEGKYRKSLITDIAVCTHTSSPQWIEQKDCWATTHTQEAHTCTRDLARPWVSTDICNQSLPLHQQTKDVDEGCCSSFYSPQRLITQALTISILLLPFLHHTTVTVLYTRLKLLKITSLHLTCLTWVQMFSINPLNHRGEATPAAAAGFEVKFWIYLHFWTAA